MTTLIVGCGYLGRRVGRLLSERGETVFGTVRSAESAGELSRWGVAPILADVLQPSSLDALPTVDRAFYCVGFDRSSGVAIQAVYVDGLRNVLGRLEGRVGRLVYASSTGVYGQTDGSLVDEGAPTEPRHESGQATLAAEQMLREFAAKSGLEIVIVRFAGLYGAGRIVRRDPLSRGEPIAGDPDKFINLIHVNDAARAAVAALDRGEPGRVYIASDDRPVTRTEYYQLVAERLGVAAPRFERPRSDSPKAGRDNSNKRVSNRRMRTELGVLLAYSDITTGIPAALVPESASEDRGSR